MVSMQKSKGKSQKKWVLLGGIIVIFLFGLVFLFKCQTNILPTGDSNGAKGKQAPQTKKEMKKNNKALPTLKTGESTKKKVENPDDFDYQAAINQNTISAYRKYIDKNTSGKHVKEAGKKIKELEEMPVEVRMVAAKASKGIKVGKNEKGLWEADCGDGIVMVYIPPGKFIMGEDDPGGEGNEDEQPAHEVYLDGYWLGKYEVTFDQYDQFVAETSRESLDYADGGWGRGKRPAISVSWHDTYAYCKWLSAKTTLNFKLPTEAQWEKAARGTAGQKFPWGDGDVNENLSNFGNESKITETTPVGSFPQGESPYGLMDMAGNVWEWCDDWYGSYSAESHKNPTGPQSGEFRVLRGGSWFDSPMYHRCANRYRAKPSYRCYMMGFRLCQEN